MVQPNPVLEAIRSRRSIIRFEPVPLEEEKIQAILDAGRWAPSWLNKQPWRFLLITDRNAKKRISEHAPTLFNIAINEAPLCIAVYVDPAEDPFHYVEAGAVATQNMALAAHSLGLGSCWIGVFSLKGDKGSAEAKIKEALHIPKPYRLVALLPIGVPKSVPAKEPNRKALSEIVQNPSSNVRNVF
jgi:nitroreductase